MIAYIAEANNADVVQRLRTKNASLVKEYRGNKPFQTYITKTKTKTKKKKNTKK